MSSFDESLFAELHLVCPGCEAHLPVAAGQDAQALIRLHERRCAPEPEIAVVCTGCDAELALTPGLSPTEIIWMHEHDCPSFQYAEAC